MALSHPQRPDWCQLLEDHLGPVPVTEGSGRTFHPWPQLPEKLVLGSLPFYVKSSEEAPGSSPKHLPLPCPPPHALPSCTHPFAGPREGLRVCSEGGSGACKARGRAWALAGPVTWFLGHCCLVPPLPQGSLAWEEHSEYGKGGQGGAGPARPGQCQAGLGRRPSSPPTLTWWGRGACCVRACIHAWTHTHTELLPSRFSFSQPLAPAGRKQRTWPRA